VSDDALFSALELDVPAAARPGYRLQRLELYNWGTFDGRIEVLRLGGDNTLVTGDIGSGKSTIVDAVTTLLLPANKINYNKAAGADTRERSLRTYVLGHYKSERNESTGSSRPVGLRGQQHYSVLLAVFGNSGFGAEVTLAQVFWMPVSTESPPRRFFVVSERDLSIEADFTDFGTDPADLKRRLRAGGASVSDHYPDYGTKLRRLLGIRSEQALELFHQTISMKSVGNLTDFVRAHMLEPAPAQSRIEELVTHFEDLSRAHEAVRKARDQLDSLGPIVAACDEHDRRAGAIEAAQRDREAVGPWVAEHRLRLIAAETARLGEDLDALEEERGAARRHLGDLTQEQAGLRAARDGLGGGRLPAIEQEKAAAAERRDERLARAGAFAALLTEVDLPAPDDATSFAHTRAALQSRRDALTDARGAETGRLADATVELREAQRVSDELKGEVRSLRGRASNIDSRSLAVRDRLAAHLGVEGARLPFAGELIQVRDDQAPWRGAAERVLRGFALSVLVPVDLYAAASRWVDDHHLGARFVYFRVGDTVARRSAPLAEHPILADVLDVKPGPYAAWVTEELAARADHVRVESVGDLARHRRAVTRQGQIKVERRHEKDDRFAIDDRTRWVLGWSNADKIDALLGASAAATTALEAARSALRAAQEQSDASSGTASILDRLLTYAQWTDLDWRTPAARIADLDAERDRLVRGNAELDALSARLAAVEDDLTSAQAAHDELTQRIGGRKHALATLEHEREGAEATLAALTGDDLERVRAAYPRLEARRHAPATLAETVTLDRDLRDALAAAIEDDQRKQSSARERAAKLIAAFRATWPADTTELGVDVAAGNEYRDLHQRIASDDLPRFEAEFKRQLNTNTINDIAAFQAWLDKSAQDIRARIHRINESLGAIDYSPGTRITLLTEPTDNEEVRRFRADVRAITDDALSSDDQYSEERFRRVQAIIERFRGRVGFTEVDRRWTEMVTDVRSWFVFAATEREVESGAEREHYTDSDGKSGGQKEKLAYTILAASLAYQFGLEWGVERARDFRFTVIDEAFGRGSDASTRYALDLFAKLGLQLLVVTPLQKVHVIEPYVQAVGFVDNRTGQRSRLQTLTIEEYQEQREARALVMAQGGSGGPGR